MSPRPLTRSLILPTDPAGLARGPRVPDIFDHAPHRNVGMRGIPAEMKALPDDRLIATLIGLGMPRYSALQVRTHPPARFNAMKVFFDVQDAAAGDIAAQERIDYIRSAFADMRKQEILADDPMRTTPMMGRS